MITMSEMGDHPMAMDPGRSGAGSAPRRGPGPRAPESPTRARWIRASAVAALAIGVVYLVWRATSTLNPDAMSLSVFLLVLEAHAWAGLALFTFALWDVGGTPTPPEELPDLGVTVLIPTYNEPVEVLLPTIAAAVALEPAHETWVLDDGRRPEVAVLAERLGARYVTRPDRMDAKAGNLNHALASVTTDLVALLDADHVPSPEFLVRTLPYFHDDTLALVQTPQDFYNETSFEHVRSAVNPARLDRVVYSDQAVFYRELQPAKNRLDGAFWCGTGAVMRTEALRSIGGVATTSITEDLQTTIRLHRAGWHTVYHDEVLARGLAADTADQYQIQRRRWCTGAMQVLRQERPLTDRELSIGQRLMYASTLLGWFDALRLVGLLLVPPLVLLTGTSPIAAPLAPFLVLFVTMLVLQQFALWRLTRGTSHPLYAPTFELARLQATLQALWVGLTEREVSFHVTPKGASGAQSRQRMRVPGLLIGLGLANLFALAWYALTLADLTVMTYAIPGVAHGAAFWAVANGSLMLLTITRIHSARFADDRRDSYRHPVHVLGHLDGRPAEIADLSLTGARVEVPRHRAPALGDSATLAIRVDGRVATFRARAVTLRPVGLEPPDSFRAFVGLDFDPDQLGSQAQLAVGLFNVHRREVRDLHEAGSRRDGYDGADASAPAQAR
jgi:cellulose synthase (UDP-forming)